MTDVYAIVSLQPSKEPKLCVCMVLHRVLMVAYGGLWRMVHMVLHMVQIMCLVLHMVWVIRARRWQAVAQSDTCNVACHHAGNTCMAPSCSDGAKNGQETGRFLWCGPHTMQLDTQRELHVMWGASMTIYVSLLHSAR